MSCYKCGKELPPGEVECPDDCGAGKSLVLCLEIPLNAEKVNADPQGFKAARAQFALMVGEVLNYSNIANYLKTQK